MQATALTALLIEDNQAISANIADYFAIKGATVDFASQGKQGLALALANYYDVIILDLTLPLLDGLAVCTALRQQANRHIPILMLTARDTLDDKLQGFSSGADDYLTKPFALEELWVRSQVLAQRQLQQPYQLRLGNLTLDKQSRQLSCAGEYVHLTPIVWQILCLLLEAHPRPISRSELCGKIWGDELTESDALRSHLYQLRKALQQADATVRLITLHGVGFALQEVNH